MVWGMMVLVVVVLAVLEWDKRRIRPQATPEPEPLEWVRLHEVEGVKVWQTIAGAFTLAVYATRTKTFWTVEGGRNDETIWKQHASSVEEAKAAAESYLYAKCKWTCECLEKADPERRR